jgi:site-specific DNA-methyltransferase (adenine-specific)
MQQSQIDNVQPIQKLNNDMQHIDTQSSPNSGNTRLAAVPLSEVYNMDCIEGMKQYPDKYFDLAIVDPPYGIRIMNAGGTPEHLGFKQYTKKDWDNEIPTPEYFEQLFRVSKNQIIWGANYFTQYLPTSMGWILWDKGQRICNSDGELAFSSFQKALRVFTLNRCAIKMEGAIHPTQKPIKLYEWLLSNYSKANDLILDTHLGSGSSRIAANKAGLNFVGFEIDKEYFDAQNKRYNDFIKQIRLPF